MQAGTGVGAKPDDVSGIGRYLRVEQDDMKHQDGALFTASGAAAVKAGRSRHAASMAVSRGMSSSGTSHRRAL